MVLLSHTYAFNDPKKDVLQKSFYPKKAQPEITSTSNPEEVFAPSCQYSCTRYFEKHLIFYLTDFQKYPKALTNLFGYFPKKLPRICLGLVELVRGKTQDSASFHGR